MYNAIDSAKPTLRERQIDHYLFEAEENDAKLEKIKNAEIYQQAKEEHKLEIANKLLAKGLSIQEVAEIVELDVDRLQ